MVFHEIKLRAYTFSENLRRFACEVRVARGEGVVGYVFETMETVLVRV